MTDKTTRYLLLSTDETDSSRRLRLLKFIHDNLHSDIVTTTALYSACQNDNLVAVKSCLKKMTLEEINYQHPPKNETTLHIATQKQHKEMIELLLQYGAQSSLKNRDGQLASELAETNEIKDLFKRPQSSRFAFSHSCSNMIRLFKGKLSCKSCLLVTNNTMYEWELVDRNAAQKAVEFRREFQAYSLMDAKIWKKKLYSLNKGYFIAHSHDDHPVKKNQVIRNYFKQALREQNPNYLLMAYTSSQEFSSSLNIAMARNVIHALTNGCSQFSCQCLYSTQDTTRTFSSLFFQHRNFEKLAFQGEVYRGIVMPKHKLGHYEVDSCIITTTLLSTSKKPDVAQNFGSNNISDPITHSFMCTYKIINDSHTAIDISHLSRYPGEEEVLILPYSAFLITKIEKEQGRTNISLEEQCLTNIFSKNSPKTE